MADENLLANRPTGNQTALDSNSVIVDTPEIAVEESVNDDILQQAFGDGEVFGQETVTYAVAGGDISETVGQQINTVVSDSAMPMDSATEIADENDFSSATYRVVTTLHDGTITIPEELMSHVVVSDETEQIESESGVEVTLTDNDDQHVLETVENQQEHLPDKDNLELQETIQTADHSAPIEEAKTVEEQPQQQMQTIRYAFVPSGNAPVGSCQNPIRIVQQGNNYTPMQQLSTDQLQQLMQVVQQKQLAKNTQESGGSVVFNPGTNTRVVYRVIYPSELHKGQQTVFHVTPKGTTTTSVPVQETVQQPKRQYRKKGKDEDEDKVDGPEMSKEEKEERKKHRPRTRCGRVSKPPSHMVKDYKHIHVLDWNEEYDDSDGGYSDYKGVEEDGGRSKDRGTPELTALAMSSSRPKNHKCQVCDKSYIGVAGLARHYRLEPSHSLLNLPEGEQLEDNGEAGNDTNVSTENTSSVLNNGSTNSGAIANSVGAAGVSTVGSSVGSSNGNLSEDSNTQDSIPSSSGAVSPITTRAPRRGRGGYRGRGRWAYRSYNAPAKRKQRLREVIKTVENEELMEVVLPRLAKCVSVFEFLLMKVETCSGMHPRADLIYQEYAGLQKHVKQVCQEGLEVKQDTGQQNGLDGEESRDGSHPDLKLDDEAVAQSLGLKTGTYSVKELPINEYSSFHYKLLTSDPNRPQGVSAMKRTIEVVTQDELVPERPIKRSRMSAPLSSSSTPSVVNLAPSATAASSLLTSIVTNSGLKGTGNKQPSMFRTVAIQQPQTSLLQTVRVQQPHGSLLHKVALQQPQTVIPNVTVQAQPAPSTVLRTVSVPSQQQSHPALRTVPMPSQSQPVQTSLLRSLQQPVVVSANRQSNGTSVGVSLLNPNRSTVVSQPPSVTVLKTLPEQTSHMLAVAPNSVTDLSEIQYSQANQVVSMLSSSTDIAPGSHLSHPSAAAVETSEAFATIATDDFMYTSDDSFVSSVSGLSSANSSGLISVNSCSLPNGEMADESFSSMVKMNGVSDLPKTDIVSMDGGQYLNNNPMTTATSSQELPEQLSVTTAMDTASSVSSVFIKYGNGELSNISNMEDMAPLTSSAADSFLSAAVDTLPSTTNIIGQLNGAQVEEVHIKGEKDIILNEESLLLTGEPEVMHQDASLGDGGDVAQIGFTDSTEQTEIVVNSSNIFQSADGKYFIHWPDGQSYELHVEEDSPVQSVQETQSIVYNGESVQAHMQQ